MNKPTLGILTALICGLSGCDRGASSSNHSQLGDPCWRIQLTMPTTNRFHDRTWETKNTPVPLGPGYYFTTDSGNAVYISGSIVIEQTTRSK